jgi:hypothetical protein
MNSLLLNNKVIIFLFSEIVIYTLAIVAFFVSILILRKWDFNSFTQFQFNLEKKSYLISTIIYFLFIVKFLLIIYFVYTIDSLSILVPGAMCAAGVISANGYGLNLLFLKLVILFLFLFYVSLNKFDLEAKNYPFIKIKQFLFLIIFALLTLELTLDFLYFFNINLNLPVSCCSALFGQLEGQNPLPFGLSIKLLLLLYGLFFIITISSSIFKQKFIALISTLLFLILSYYAIVYFFGTYVYELPTHKCPFCMMQKEYYYIGYLIWISLFLGGFLNLIWAINLIAFKKDGSNKLAIILLVLSFLINLLYVLIYYLKNGVFL